MLTNIILRNECIKKYSNELDQIREAIQIGHSNVENINILQKTKKQKKKNNNNNKNKNNNKKNKKTKNNNSCQKNSKID